MFYFFYFLLLCLQNIAFIELICTAFGYQLTYKKAIVPFMVLLSAVPQFVFVLPQGNLNPIFGFLLLFLMMMLKASCYAVLFQQVRIKMLYISVLSFVLNTNYTNIMHILTSDPNTLNILAVATEFILTVSALIYIRKKDLSALVMESIASISRRLYMIILFFLYFFSFFIYTIVIKELNHLSNYLLIPVILFTTYIIFRVVLVSAEARKNQKISNFLSEQLENQVAYYQKINDIYTEFRAFRHDYRNHLLCLHSLLEANEVERACEYMDQIENMSQPRKKNYDTGNIIVDSLLNDKSEKAVAHHAQIVFTGYAPTTGITNVDLCTIFANALDNAIEACAKDNSDQEKQIQIHSDFQQGYYSLHITNPVFEKVEIKNGNQVKTSKKDKSNHGFGVSNIVRTTQKYGGDTEISCRDQKFILEVSLWLNPEIA